MSTVKTAGHGNENHSGNQLAVNSSSNAIVNGEMTATMWNNEPTSKALGTTMDGTPNFLSVPSRKSSVSPATTVTGSSQGKSSVTIECEEGSYVGGPEISDFVIETDLSRNALSVNNTTKKSKKLIKKVLSMSEQVDEFIDQCIEIESNKRMFQENVNWFLLTFESRDYESAVR